MLWTLLTILIALWLLGVGSGTMVGGFIHTLLALAAVLLLLRLIQGKYPVL